MADGQQDHQVSTPQTVSHEALNRPVIGIYGIPGSGKSFLLNRLKQEFQGHCFEFLEGSQLIASTVPGGLAAFQALKEQDKTHWRELAIKNAARASIANDKVAVIAGHHLFWKEHEEEGTVVTTSDDLRTYTHILYLDIPADIVQKRREQDTTRDRPLESVSHLSRWQEAEKSELRRLCYDHGILFSIITEGPHMVNRVVLLLQHFQSYTEAHNRSIVQAKLDRIFEDSRHPWETLVIMDADKTLTASDTGEMFWEKVAETCSLAMRKNSLKEVFTSKMGYTHNAFVQAMLLYEEIGADEFDKICKTVASATVVYPELLSLLQAIAESSHTGAVIVTCGLRQIWQAVLEREGLSDRIKVIGGGRLADGLVVTGDTKADLVSRAKCMHNAFTYAFGDSPLDLKMLKEADRAIVIVGEEQSRSQSMEIALNSAIEDGSLQAHQAMIPSTATPRLSLDKLPAIQLTDYEFAREILGMHPRYKTLDIIHATEKDSAKLLMTPMRNSQFAGPRLREAHRLVGHYLATEFLSEISGVEEYSITHVQGHQTTGYRILHERETVIVALMRGGEPMAFGVNDVLPDAMFLHANSIEDLHQEHLQGRLNVILVDSVVNSGNSLLEFVQYIRNIHATIRIIAIAGVVQSGAVTRLDQEACCHLNFKLIALRLSDNKFTGRGGTDTGNRLFNTTHLD